MQRKHTYLFGIVLVIFIIALTTWFGFSRQSHQTSSLGTENAQSNTSTPVQPPHFFTLYYERGFEFTQPNFDNPNVNGTVRIEGKIKQMPPNKNYLLAHVKRLETLQEEMVKITPSTDGSFSADIPLTFGSGIYNIRIDTPLQGGSSDNTNFDNVISFDVINH